MNTFILRNSERCDNGVASYLHEVQFASMQRRPIPQPQTTEQLDAVRREMPSIGRRLRLAGEQVGTYGEQLAKAIGHAPVEPLSELEQERILATLATDSAFRTAFRNLLRMEQTA